MKFDFMQKVSRTYMRLKILLFFILIPWDYKKSQLIE